MGFQFDIEDDLDDEKAVKAHVDTWFQNIGAGELFDPGEPAVAALDYSLQLDAATFRMCRACRAGEMTGATPSLCIAAGFFTDPQCTGSSPAHAAAPLTQVDKRALEVLPPPRQ